MGLESTQGQKRGPGARGVAGFLISAFLCLSGVVGAPPWRPRVTSPMFRWKIRDGPRWVARPINISAPLIMNAFGAEDRVQFKSKPNEHVLSRMSAAGLRGDMYLSRSMCLSGGEVGLKSRTRSLRVALVCYTGPRYSNRLYASYSYELSSERTSSMHA
jgi:hypothetical protein